MFLTIWNYNKIPFWNISQFALLENLLFEKKRSDIQNLFDSYNVFPYDSKKNEKRRKKQQNLIY